MESFMELPVLMEWAHQMPFTFLDSIATATTVAATVATTEGAIVVIIAN